MASTRVYSVVMDSVAVSAAQDLFTIKTSTSVPIEIISVVFSQKTLTAWEAKDITLRRLGPTVTVTAGTSVTAQPFLPTEQASSVTATINNTTVATTTGTSSSLQADDFMFLNGFLWTPAGYDGRFVVGVSSAFCVRLGTAPSASMTMSGTVTFGELV